MRKYFTIAISLIAATLFAQTATVPVPIDWRYRLDWNDPNVPAGQVASWTVFASNNVVVRTASTRLLTIDLQPLLNGAPAGTYALFTVPVSQLGDVGDAGTNLFVVWPGGNGKLKGGVNQRVGK